MNAISELIQTIPGTLSTVLAHVSGVQKPY